MEKVLSRQVFVERFKLVIITQELLSFPDNHGSLHKKLTYPR